MARLGDKEENEAASEEFQRHAGQVEQRADHNLTDMRQYARRKATEKCGIKTEIYRGENFRWRPEKETM